MYNPLEQFKVNPLLNFHIFFLDFSFTNTAFYLFFSIFLYICFTILSRSNKLIPNPIYYFLTKLYQFSLNQFMEILTKKANIFFPFVNSIFLFILFNNLIGLIPYSFTTTSQIIITLSMSMIIVLGVTFLGFRKYKLSFYKVFLPKGLPAAILPIIFVIEVISYLSRIVSLSVRLSANMIAGHTILNIISTATGHSLSIHSLVLLIPLFFILILELGVAIIQAFVFAVLTSTYIKDMVDLH